MSDVTALMSGVASIFGGLFSALDSVYFSGYSLLDILIGIELFSSTCWFVMEVIRSKGVSS